MITGFRIYLTDTLIDRGVYRIIKSLRILAYRYSRKRRHQFQTTTRPIFYSRAPTNNSGSKTIYSRWRRDGDREGGGGRAIALHYLQDHFLLIQNPLRKYWGSQLRFYKYCEMKFPATSVDFSSFEGPGHDSRESN